VIASHSPARVTSGVEFLDENGGGLSVTVATAATAEGLGR